MEASQSWYIVKQKTGSCKIVPSEQASGDDTEITQKWGLFSSKEEAIARRIGLIRTGKCQPI
ncbi:MAG: DDE transposase family protein [Rivularia sp. T60_A2020_040]|nr:DDE transposase family protein [Rivularia sp. T60_A2020_040]